MTLGLLLVAAWIVTDMALGSSSDTAPPLYLLWSSLNYWLRALFAAALERGVPVTQHLAALLPPAAAYPLTCLVLLIGGGLCAAGAGLIIGIPVLRLRGDYLAIATLGFAEIIAVLINNSEPLGGALGLSDIPRFVGFGWIYGVAILTTIAVWRLTHSARGRAMLAVREDEVAASAIGIDPARSRILAFVVGAFFAGVAGALFAHYEGYITPRHFQFMRSIELVVMVTLAGAGSLSGTILAATVLTVMPELLRSFSEWRMVIYSLLLIIMMLLRPEGLLGSRELIPRRWRGGANASS
jgi:branched-chain amino acid transport system permease protein